MTARKQAKMNPGKSLTYKDTWQIGIYINLVNFTLRVDNITNRSQKSPAVVGPPLVGRL